MAAKSVANINITLMTRVGKFISGMRRSRKAMQKFKLAGRGMFRGMQGSITRLIAMVFALRAAFIGLGNILGQIFEREAIFAKLQIFERTIAKTKKTFGELSEFAARTPFRLNELAKGFLLLRSLGGKKLGTIDMVKKLGDAAITTGVGFDVIAANVGRMFNSLKKGNIGQTSNELRSYGLLSTEVQDKIEAMGKAGASQGEMFKVFLKGLKKFDGAMEIMSMTMTGVISTFKDLLTVKFAEALDPWLGVIKQFLIQINKSDKLLQGFISVSKRAFKALQGWAFGNNKMNPNLEKFFSLLIIAPKVIAKTLKKLFGMLMQLFGFVNKEVKGLAGSSLLAILNAVLGFVLKFIKLLPNIVDVIVSLVKVFQEIQSNAINMINQVFQTAGKFSDIIFSEIKKNAKAVTSDIIGAFLFAIQKVSELPWGKILKMMMNPAEGAAFIAKEFAKAIAIINADLGKKFSGAKTNIEVAMEQAVTPLDEAVKELRKKWKELKKLMAEVSIGDAAGKDMDKLKKKLAELIKGYAKALKDLPPIPGAEGASSKAAVKKFAGLAQEGSDAAFKAIIDHMFGKNDKKNTVEEKQLSVQEKIYDESVNLNRAINNLDKNSKAIRIW